MTPTPKGARLAKGNRTRPPRSKAVIADFDRFDRLAEASPSRPSPGGGKAGGAARAGARSGSLLPAAEARRRLITTDPCPHVEGEEHP
jgi:hypothetical protein